MNNKNKDLLNFENILKKITSVIFSLGVRNLNKPIEKLFLKNIVRMDPSLYILYSKMSDYISIGFKTFYCGVNTYIPPEFKNYWISDHHILSVFYKIGLSHFNIIPFNNELYTISLQRTDVPFGCNPESIYSFMKQFVFLNDIKSWIDLFYLNNDSKILSEQGLVFPKFEPFNEENISTTIKSYKIALGLRYISDARKLVSKNLKNALVSITI